MASNVNIEEEEEEQGEERKEGRNRRRKRKRKGRINVEHRMMVSFQFNISGAQCNLHFLKSFYRLKHRDLEICLVTYICFPKLKSKILSYETVGILTSELMYYMP